LSICPEGIAGQCRNRKYYYKGFYWIYKDDYSDNIVFNHGLNKIPIFAFNKNRELIGEFINIKAASIITGISYSAIYSSITRRVCKIPKNKLRISFKYI